MDFTSLNLCQPLLDALDEIGYVSPTPIQAQAIPDLIEGRDLLGCAQTGTGKTAAFALPALHSLDTASRSTQVLILSPTRELAQQVGKAFEQYGAQEKATILTIYGGASYGYQKGVLKKGAQVVVGTPGRLLDLISQGNLQLDEVKLLVLDEADEMLSMGFKQQLDEILSALRNVENKWLFSATMPHGIKQIVNQHMAEDAHRIQISRDVVNKNIEHKFLQ